jgi:ferrous iron transport protein A
VQTKLSKLKTGILAEVLTIEKSPISAKLVEMGLFKGQCVEVLFKAPMGDPIAISVGSYVLSLRLNEAELIEVKPL